MTNVLIIGDVVCTKTGHDMIIGFTPEDKVILDRRGLSDEEYFEVIGHAWSQLERMADNTLPLVTLYIKDDRT